MRYILPLFFSSRLLQSLTMQQLFSKEGQLCRKGHTGNRECAKRSSQRKDRLHSFHERGQHWATLDEYFALLHVLHLVTHVILVTLLHVLHLFSNSSLCMCWGRGRIQFYCIPLHFKCSDTKKVIDFWQNTQWKKRKEKARLHKQWEITMFFAEGLCCKAEDDVHFKELLAGHHLCTRADGTLCVKKMLCLYQWFPN